MNKKYFEIARAALKKSTTAGKIDPGKVKQQIAILLTSETSQTLKILKAYKKLLLAKLVKEQIIVSSVVSLDSKLQKQLEDFFQNNFDNLLPTEYSIDESLTGGLKIQIGDTVIDSSLNQKIKLLESIDD